MALKFHRADVNATDALGNNALYYLARGWTEERRRVKRYYRIDDIDVVRDLIGFAVQMQAKNHNGITPLQYAAQLGKHGIFDHMLHAGAYVDQEQGNGQPPDWFIAFQQRKAMLKQKKVDWEDICKQTHAGK